MHGNRFNLVILGGLTLALTLATSSIMAAANGSDQGGKRAEGAEVEVVGICLIKPDPDNKYGGSSVPGQQPGTSIHLRIHDKNQYVISIKDDSNVQLIAKGKTLTEDEPSNFGFMTQISDDGHTCSIPVHGEHLPPDGASNIQVKGVVRLVAGSDSTTDQQELELKQGTKLTLAGIPVEISEVGEPWDDEYAVQIQFQAKKSFDAIQKIEFLDESNKPIESISSGRSSFGFGNNYTYAVDYSLKSKPAKLVVKVTYFQTTKDIEIPVDVQVGLGIGSR